jgi:hypothetical protein
VGDQACRVWSALVLALALAACREPEVQPIVVAMSTSIDPAELEWSRHDGTNAVRGFAVMRTLGGQPRTCAGEEVFLTPDSPYARERAMAMYGSIVKGTRSTAEPVLRFTNRDVNFDGFRRKTRCDARGEFSFEAIPDGVWYVATLVTWSDGYNVWGGAMMRRVELRGKQTIKVALP